MVRTVPAATRDTFDMNAGLGWTSPWPDSTSGLLKVSSFSMSKLLASTVGHKYLADINYFQLFIGQVSF